MPVVTWTAADFFVPSEHGQRCQLCPFECDLHEGQTGRCHVRRLEAGRPETLTRATAVQHWTPIERKPFYHFRPGLTVLTLAPPGCNWTCDYCQNFRLSQFGRDDAAIANSLTLEPVEPRELVAQAHRVGAAIALSYTEPTLAAELTLELAAARDRLAAPGLALPLLWKTNGFITRTALRRLAPHLAAVNIDLKSADETAHRSFTGAPLGPVLDAITGFLEHGVWVELSTPLVPGLNSSPAEIDRLVRCVARFGIDVPWHWLRFTPEFRLRQLAPTPVDDLARAVSAARTAGLRYVYVEKALGPGGRRTLCPHCQTTLVDRDALPVVSVVNGRCPTCGQSIPGHW